MAQLPNMMEEEEAAVQEDQPRMLPQVMQQISQGREESTALPPMPESEMYDDALVDFSALPMDEGMVQGPMESEIPFNDFQADDWVMRVSDLEGFHGSVPTPTRDSSEWDIEPEKRSADLGYGHKTKKSEIESGYIHGIRFIDDAGEYIPLTENQLLYILDQDIKEHVDLARRINWDKHLESLGGSWDELAPQYQEALGSLAMNVGGTKAGNQWKKVLEAALNENDLLFAKEMRRQDNEKWTHGMDNRAAKELYAAGIISSLDDLIDPATGESVLPLATSDATSISQSTRGQGRAQTQSTNNYTVQSGDNLTRIANQNNVSIDDLVEWNNLANPNAIRAGQRLRLTPPE
jgi:hypothetical protein